MSEREEVKELSEFIRGIDGPATLGGWDLAEAIIEAGWSK